ncbi:MAG: hypothetical protein CVV53_08020 [Spirochaetae bacterium HGW-Spirochaetae-9]|nr:MAG: hypothetical protein CVV53_08020 [Spirochaetae bacterium HGW-Spirochaetae-9]
MALIKSALELALERTKNLEVDEIAIEANRIRMEGRRTAGKFLDDPESCNLVSAISGVDTLNRELFRKSVFDVLCAQIQLPGVYFDAGKITVIGTGLGTLAAAAPGRSKAAGTAAEKQVASMMQQISAFLTKYQEEVKRVEQAIRSQWAPKLKEKERQMAARMGQEIRLDPMADPEFAAFYKKNVEGLKASYGDALEQAKLEISAICGFIEVAKD